MNTIIERIIETQKDDDTIEILHKTLFTYIAHHAIHQSNICIDYRYNLRSLIRVEPLRVWIHTSISQKSSILTIPNNEKSHIEFYPTKKLPYSSQTTHLSIPYESIYSIFTKGTHYELQTLLKGFEQKYTKLLRNDTGITKKEQFRKQIQNQLKQ
jgi:hypothetical protein